MNKNDQILRVQNALAILEPDVLEVKDESDKHQGHEGHKEGVLTHIHVTIGSKKFENITRIQRHKMVNAALAAEIKDFLHAIRVTIVGC